MKVRLVVCALMGLARLAELVYSRRNLEHHSGAGEGRWSRRTYPLVVALHSVTIVGTATRGGHLRWPWLLALLSAQPLRLWVLWTLRRSWNVRGAVPAELDVQTGGPYAFIRHPNYLVVLVELATLPLAFGLKSLAILATLANVALLAIRIRDEESLLFREPSYRRNFRKKARLIPGVF